MAAILAQVGHFYFGAVGQFYIGANTYEIAERPLPAMIERMLTKAFDRLDSNDRPILHSDQGWHYRMPSFRRRLQRKGLVQSMSRRGNCLDNAAMESFFGTLKCELFYVNKFESIETLEEALHDYIRYYNADRIKLSLKGLSPIEYRQQAAIDLGRLSSGRAERWTTWVDHEYMGQPGPPPAAWQGPEEKKELARKNSYTAA
jgi:transposase InsO family protein